MKLTTMILSFLGLTVCFIPVFDTSAQKELPPTVQVKVDAKPAVISDKLEKKSDSIINVINKSLEHVAVNQVKSSARWDTSFEEINKLQELVISKLNKKLASYPAFIVHRDTFYAQPRFNLFSIFKKPSKDTVIKVDTIRLDDYVNETNNLY